MEFDFFSKHRILDNLTTYLRQLGEKCQTILRLFFQGETMRAIAQQMGYTEKFAKNKKYLCTKKLLKEIQNTKIYQELHQHG